MTGPAFELTVLVFGPLADLAGAPQVTVTLDTAKPTVADVLARLAERSPALGARLQSAAVAINHEYVARDAAVAPGDEVALIPPVSGG